MPSRFLARFIGSLAIAASVACSSSSESGNADAGPSNPDAGATRSDREFETAGRYPVGNSTFTVTDTSRSRSLVVEVWYPAAENARAAAEAGTGAEDFLGDQTERTAYADLLGSAPAGCPSTRTGSARDADAAPGSSWPVIVFSHCHSCTRFSAFSVAERLASHGFVVAAPDHTLNTLFDELAGTPGPLTAEFLQTRGADMSFVLDVLLDATATVVPEAVRGKLDAQKVGAMGHSFGSVTTGLVLQDDPRFVAGFAMAAPFENPLLVGVDVTRVSEPVMFLLAREDNSITEIGNELIRDNFARIPAPAWKAEVTDAGHWSFSDLCAINDGFSACCGDGIRQTVAGEAFTYLTAERGRQIGATYAVAFFRSTLADDDLASTYLSDLKPDDAVSIESRNPQP